MDYEEFKRTVFYTRNKIIIPFLTRPQIDKSNFIRRGKFKTELVDKFLRKWYEEHKDRLN